MSGFLETARIAATALYASQGVAATYIAVNGVVTALRVMEVQSDPVDGIGYAQGVPDIGETLSILVGDIPKPQQHDRIIIAQGVEKDVEYHISRVYPNDRVETIVAVHAS